MKFAFLKRGSAWLPTVLVLVVVLGAGGRLTSLSVQEHAEQARQNAQALGTRCARAIEAQLQSLARVAYTASARAANVFATAAPASDAAADGANPSAAALRSIVPLGHDVFWMTQDGSVITSKDSDKALARALASEWTSADAAHRTAPAALLGPVRQGSQWYVAARFPIVVTTADTTQSIGWSVAYIELDRLLASAHLARVVDAGFDFAMTQLDPTSGGTRIFVSSRSSSLDGAMAIPIRSPAGFARGLSGGELRMEIIPRNGWYPLTELAADIGLLAVLAWAIGFTTHDIIHRVQRLRAALAVSRGQLRTAHQRLMNEVEQRENLQKSFDHARYHDAFTGLPNRRYFMDQLDRALRDVRSRKRRRIAVVLIDIDRFALINETLGHTAGDELMVQAARRFEKATAALECVLARWGGNQFAVVVFDVESPEAALTLANDLQTALQEPFDLRRHRLSVTARMGIACADGGPQRADDLLREADIAVAFARRHENTRSVAYAPAMGGDVASLVSLEADLHVALERNELMLLYQPIVDLHSRHMVGAEVLLRWRHPVEGILRPDKFLGIAEESGLIVPITRWIIRRVARLANDWRRRLPQARFYLSVNLSATVLRDPGLAEYVGQVLRETDTPPDVLKFELTEGGLISNVGVAREALEQLHNMGIELMLDDFGTGYSSLNYLQLFPFDFVKIDRPRVDGNEPESANGGLTSAMVQMAASLGLTAIAEVVETQATAQILEQMGCRFGQGYFFSAPIEAEEALQCLRGEDFRRPREADATMTTVTESWGDDSPTLLLPVLSESEDGSDIDPPRRARPRSAR
jgi:diguanylate cyclase (GGDEF)-like protein